MAKKTTKKKAGRRSKLTPAVQKKVCELIASGNFLKVAAQAAGIAERTFYDWLAKGEAEKAPRYVQFLQAVQEAAAKGETELLEQIRTAGESDWRANAWVLGRRFRERWRDEAAVEATVEHKGGVRIKTWAELNAELGPAIRERLRRDAEEKGAEREAERKAGENGGESKLAAAVRERLKVLGGGSGDAR